MAGAAADRFDRRKIIVTVSTVQVVAALMLLTVGPGRLWLAFVAQAAISALGAFVLPAAQAAVPNLTRDAEELREGGGAVRLHLGRCASGASVAGSPPCSAGTRPSSLTHRRSAAAALVATIRRPMQEARRATRDQRRLRPLLDMKEGLGYARRDPVLWRLRHQRRRSPSVPAPSASWPCS